MFVGNIYPKTDMLNWLKTLYPPPQKMPCETAVAGSSNVPARQTAVLDKSTAYKNLGDKYLEEGKLDGAEESYRQAIAINPNFAEAYNNLGNALREQKRYGEAEYCFKQAISKKPELSNAYFNLGYILQEQGRLNETIENFTKGLKFKPDAEIIYRDLSYALFQLGQHEAARQIIAKGLALNPGFADFHFFLGNMHWHENELDKAVVCYQQALSIQPDYADIHSNLGKVFQAQGRLDEAIACFRKALALKPDFAETYVNLGNILMEQAKPIEAIACYQQALVIKPDAAEVYYNLGLTSKTYGKYSDAIAYYQKAAELKPDFADAYCNLGNVFFEQGKPDEALVCYRKALAIKPHFANAWYGMGVTHVAQQKNLEAVACFRQTLALESDHFTARTQMLYQLQHMCEWGDLEENIIAVRQKVLESLTTSKNLLSPLAFLAIPGATAEEQKLCAERWTQGKFEALFSLHKKMGFKFNRTPDKRISIGYISADFRQHPVSFLMAEVFELHDRNRFHITAYSYGPDDGSAMRKRLKKAFDNFVDIRDDSYEEAARKIHADHIEILVDLTGHTQDSRSGILALRPAPIQVNYLGYPGTMGADFIDYMIADRFTIPPEKQQHYTEKVVWMPDCFQANDRARPRPASPSRKDCGLPEAGVVFCCFNQTAKITPEMFDIWCRLLRAVPGSILWLPACNPQAEGNLRREAENRGVEAGRLIMAPLLHREEHLTRLQCADLFLDTLPFNAGTTCSDALWMGLPVVTCAGDAFASRMAGSLLTAIGVPELITYSLDDYYNLALDLSTDRKKLEAIRSKIIANRDTTPLFDSVRFTRNLEKAYTQMLEEYSKKSAPSF